MIFLDPVFYIVNMALDLYLLLIIVSVVLSWLTMFNIINTSNRLVYAIVDFLYRITEPALRRIRRFMPDLGNIDIAPIVLIFGVYFSKRLLSNIHQYLLTV